MFSAGDELLAIDVPGLRVISTTFVFASVTVVLGYAMSGLGNGVILMVGTLIRQFILLLPAAYALIRFAGIEYAWFAFVPAELAALIFMAVASLKMYAETEKRYRGH